MRNHNLHEAENGGYLQIGMLAGAGSRVQWGFMQNKKALRERWGGGGTGPFCRGTGVKMQKAKCTGPFYRGTCEWDVKTECMVTWQGPGAREKKAACIGPLCRGIGAREKKAVCTGLFLRGTGANDKEADCTGPFCRATGERGLKTHGSIL
jgi:hypothetical protein